MLVLSARDRIGAGDRFVARRVFESVSPVVIALNKIDRLKHGHVASQMKQAAALGDFHALHPCQRQGARRHRRTARTTCSSCCPKVPPLFPLEQSTDLTLEERVAEVIREKALHLTRDEVRARYRSRSWELRREGRRRAVVLVETESQKGILVGKRGAIIRGDRNPGTARRSRHSSGGRCSSSSSSRCGPVATRPEDARAARGGGGGGPLRRDPHSSPRPRRLGRQGCARPSATARGGASSSSTKSRPAITSTRSGVAATTVAVRGERERSAISPT